LGKIKLEQEMKSLTVGMTYRKVEETDKKILVEE
jgi:hypothetical protein